LKKTFVSGTGKRKKIQKAVDGVSFVLKRGDTLGLIGSSGCGKTTTLRMLLGLLKPDSGQVYCNGQIGFVGQDPYATLVPTFTAGQNIAEPLLFTRQERNYAACREKVRHAMEVVHLDFDTYENRLPSQMSGGERQRVSIARAMILQPDFLILDEPTSMLDEAVKGKITEVIHEIADSGQLGVILVTHDIAVASGLCKWLMVMQDGKVVEEGLSQQVFGNPQQTLTKSLIAVATDVKRYWETYKR
jgi:ABC-type glutathione transport system ATPase component